MDEGDTPVDKDYVNAPVFLNQVRSTMGDENFKAFLRDVYETYKGEIADTEGILKLLRSHNDSAEIEKTIAFFFKE